VAAVAEAVAAVAEVGAVGDDAQEGGDRPGDCAVLKLLVLPW